LQHKGVKTKKSNTDNDHGKIIIAGPCSAESHKQLLAAAKPLAEQKRVDYFRAGLWKPRTRPDSFQGVGNEGLMWMQEIKKECGLKIITEVAIPQHVEQCLKAGFDALWIGARTVSNPFSVQQIADALEGCKIPVFVKNPMSPDIDLWIGAIERIKKAGIKKVAAIHRGFMPYEKTRLRNIPKWEIAIDLKTRCPEIPILCDASHISGKASLVHEISQYALDLSFDGLMIEVHNNPPSARSDKQQQLTPVEFEVLMTKLLFKADEVNNLETEIMRLRSQIDSIDFQLLELIANRMEIVDKIGDIKRKNHITIFQLKRWKNILETRLKAGKELGISEEFLYKLLDMVHRESIRVQTENNSTV